MNNNIAVISAAAEPGGGGLGELQPAKSLEKDKKKNIVLAEHLDKNLRQRASEGGLVVGY